MTKKKDPVGPLHYLFKQSEKCNYYKRRFYSDSNEFSFFELLTPVTIEKIEKSLNDLFPTTKYPRSSLIRYFAVLDYLMNNKVNNDFKVFDYKIAFLIQAIDPDLSIYYHLLTTGFSPSDPEEITASRARSIISFIEKTVGIFDPEFLKYEQVYFQKVKQEGRVLSNIKFDESKKLLDSFKGIPNFDEIKETEFQLLSNKANYYFSVCRNPKDVCTLSFNINNPNSVLELFNVYRKAVFFILVIDPELIALRIYEEESTAEQIRERMILELGFYHEGFVKLEQLYRKRFFPEKSISEWSYK